MLAQSGTRPVPVELRELCQRVVDEHGPRLAAELLGVNASLVARVLAGYPVRPGSLALLREAQARIEGPDAPEAA
ncbi:MAG: hypothetical protein Q8R28_12285 [Dehalococcoidia bacterium]|nr:hypothetical protein [Dehalococcoidia bacterium]